MRTLKIWLFFVLARGKSKTYINGHKVRYNPNKKFPYRIGKLSFDYRPGYFLIRDLARDF